MSVVIQSRATLEDLYRTPGKAELIGGRIVHFMATAHKPALVGFRIAMSLHEYSDGTLVVWDVDPLAECIHVYRASDPSQPTTYCRGQLAEAEPAVPGWRVAVELIFS